MKKEVRRLIGFFSYFRNFIPALAETARVIKALDKLKCVMKSIVLETVWIDGGGLSISMGRGRDEQFILFASA